MSAKGQTSRYRMYIGSYTNRSETGLRLYTLDTVSGIAVPEGPAEMGSMLPQLSYLAMDPKRGILYAVSETMETDGVDGGSAAAYAIGREDGKLRLLDRRRTRGGAPCHLSLLPDGKHLAVANYMGGSVILYPLDAEGRLREEGELICHQGPMGPNAERQEAPHAHSVLPDPSGHYIVAMDLGTDRLKVYQVENRTGHAHKKLWSLHTEIAAAPGAGPRLSAFHPAGDVLYVLNELNCTVAVYEWDAAAGSCRFIQALSTLQEGFEGFNTCAHLQVSTDGRYLYASNRGQDSITVFRIADDSWTLTALGHFASGGRTPRFFTMTPDSSLLLAANQDSDEVVIFRIDPETGMPAETLGRIAVPEPVCIAFADFS